MITLFREGIVTMPGFLTEKALEVAVQQVEEELEDMQEQDQEAPLACPRQKTPVTWPG